MVAGELTTVGHMGASRSASTTLTGDGGQGGKGVIGGFGTPGLSVVSGGSVTGIVGRGLSVITVVMGFFGKGRQ